MKVKILPQPDDVTCGPTSLHAIYHHFGYNIPLPKLISEIEMLEGGGTLGVFLGLDALRRGFNATIHSVNLQIFDPTWVDLSMDELHWNLPPKKRTNCESPSKPTCALSRRAASFPLKI